MSIISPKFGAGVRRKTLIMVRISAERMTVSSNVTMMEKRSMGTRRGYWRNMQLM